MGYFPVASTHRDTMGCEWGSSPRLEGPSPAQAGSSATSLKSCRQWRWHWKADTSPEDLHFLPRQRSLGVKSNVKEVYLKWQQPKRWQELKGGSGPGGEGWHSSPGWSVVQVGTGLRSLSDKPSPHQGRVCSTGQNTVIGLHCPLTSTVWSGIKDTRHGKK
jgi:hypothetical protein